MGTFPGGTEVTSPGDLVGPPTHVVVVEDDAATRRLTVDLLESNGFRASGVRDARELWEKLEADPADLIILDVQLPGASGMDICRALRVRSGVPVIMVTARGDEPSRVLGLELGADDYVPKPYGRSELVARVRAVLRRSVGQRQDQTTLPGASRKLGFAGWVLDLARRELTAPDASSVELSAAEFDMLLALAEHPQRIMPRDRLLEIARDRVGTVSDRTVDVIVSRLRRKIEADEDAPNLIRTVRGSGYMFLPAVRRL